MRLEKQWDSNKNKKTKIKKRKRRKRGWITTRIMNNKRKKNASKKKKNNELWNMATFQRANMWLMSCEWVQAQIKIKKDEEKYTLFGFTQIHSK